MNGAKSQTCINAVELNCHPALGRNEKDSLMSRSTVVLLICVLSAGNISLGQVASHAQAFSKPAAPAVAPAAPAVPPSAVIAEINGVKLTQAELTAQEEVYFPYASMHGGKIPAGAEKDIREMALHKLVLDELCYQEARRRHFAASEAELQKGLKEIRSRFDTTEAYKAAIVKKYGSEAGLLRQARRTLMIRQLWDAEVKRKSVVTPVELRAYYDKNRAKFVQPESVSLQTISIGIPKEATDPQKLEARRRTEAVLAKAKAAKNYEEFGVLAERESEDDWRVMMGDHKWVHRMEVGPQFEVIFSMKPGTVSGIVESKDGFHIMRVNDHQNEHQLRFAEVRDKLSKDLLAKRMQERSAAFENVLKKNAKIVMTDTLQ
jgi:peptidyl-prolyl cis-trans isomerase C